MASRWAPIRSGRAKSRRGTGLRILGFLTVAVGFLTVRAGAAPFDDELLRLDRLESGRDQLLASADSLGRLLGTIPPGDETRAGNLLREAERLGDRSHALDLEILLARDRCRSLALQELESSDGSESPGTPDRRDELKRLLDGRLSRAPQGDFVVVEPDSSDGYETLLDKQAYLRDLRDRIVALDELSGKRVESLSREQALLRASQGFADESRFLDEGGRVGSGDLLLRQPGSPPDDGGHARVLGSVVETGREDDPLHAAPSESTSIGSDLGALRGTRARLRDDLARVDALLSRTDALLDRFVPSH